MERVPKSKDSTWILIEASSALKLEPYFISMTMKKRGCCAKISTEGRLWIFFRAYTLTLTILGIYVCGMVYIMTGLVPNRAIMGGLASLFTVPVIGSASGVYWNIDISKWGLLPSTS
jgi:hypothetical protein